MSGEEIHRQVVDLDRALSRLGGNEKMLRDLAALFLEEYPGWMNRLERAVAQEDADEVFRVAHDLKGATDIFAAASVVKAAQQMEKMGRYGELSDVDELLGELKAELVWVRTALKSYLKGEA